MIRVNNEEAGVQLDPVSGIRLVGVETSLVVTMGGGGGGVFYVRPSRIEIPDDRAIRVTGPGIEAVVVVVAEVAGRRGVPWL